MNLKDKAKLSDAFQALNIRESFKLPKEGPALRAPQVSFPSPPHDPQKFEIEKLSNLPLDFF